jgi:Acyl-CoA carboxylase epsilon subunit
MLVRMHADPLLRVIKGVPTAEELAALVGAVLTLRPAPAAAAPAVPSRWRRSALPAGTGLRPGPGAWRASTLPR